MVIKNFIEKIFLYSDDSPLFFTRLYFWGFLAVVILFYSFLYKRRFLRNIYLFFVSLFFYYKSGGYFFSLLIFSTILDYTLGILIYNTRRKVYKNLYLALSIIANLGVLAYFKYAYFFVDILNYCYNYLAQQIDFIVPHKFEVVNLLAKWTNDITGSNFDIRNIILPVGISFYTFQTISYSIDVYRGKIKPVRNIIDYGFYVSFFPQLVAGPIVRAAQFIPQLYKKYVLTDAIMGHAFFLILKGMVKKLLISDYISINFVDRVFDSPFLYTGFENLMALYAYSLQIYCDFSGYTDIAIGVALLFGFRLPINFNSPYKATSVTDFWRRWHISLSSWLRDYLYIPLGGSRKGKIRTYINLMITMLLGGLWHGANYRFIIWGGIHGITLVIHKLWLKFFNYFVPDVQKEVILSKLSYRFISIFVTFNIVSFAWVFFRARDMNTAMTMLNQIFSNFHFNLIPQILGGYFLVYFIIVLGFIFHWFPNTVKEYYRGWFIQIPIYTKVLVIVLFVFVMYQVQTTELQPFIYFRF